MPRTNVIDISSNESSPIQNNFIPTTLAPTITPPILSQTAQPNQLRASHAHENSRFNPRAHPLSLFLYLTSIVDFLLEASIHTPHHLLRFYPNNPSTYSHGSFNIPPTNHPSSEKK
ncbi:hypothetical protein Tco_1094016 [Tanacetum coccineum]|uniref:Uncharacterized protein n=1 Tax=Tanacetum coccineum TaxID=301880 RepID=A0ABQ5IGP6_9ASTR